MPTPVTPGPMPAQSTVDSAYPDVGTSIWNLTETTGVWLNNTAFLGGSGLITRIGDVAIDQNSPNSAFPLKSNLIIPDQIANPGSLFAVSCFLVAIVRDGIVHNTEVIVDPDDHQVFAASLEEKTAMGLPNPATAVAWRITNNHVSTSLTLDNKFTIRDLDDDNLEYPRHYVVKRLIPATTWVYDAPNIITQDAGSQYDTITKMEMWTEDRGFQQFTAREPTANDVFVSRQQYLINDNVVPPWISSRFYYNLRPGLGTGDVVLTDINGPVARLKYRNINPDSIYNDGSTSAALGISAGGTNLNGTINQLDAHLHVFRNKNNLNFYFKYAWERVNDLPGGSPLRAKFSDHPEQDGVPFTYSSFGNVANIPLAKLVGLNMAFVQLRLNNMNVSRFNNLNMLYGIDTHQDGAIGICNEILPGYDESEDSYMSQDGTWQLPWLFNKDSFHYNNYDGLPLEMDRDFLHHANHEPVKIDYHVHFTNIGFDEHHGGREYKTLYDIIYTGNILNPTPDDIDIDDRIRLTVRNEGISAGQAQLPIKDLYASLALTVCTSLNRGLDSTDPIEIVPGRVYQNGFVIVQFNATSDYSTPGYNHWTSAYYNFAACDDTVLVDTPFEIDRYSVNTAPTPLQKAALHPTMKIGRWWQDWWTDVGSPHNPPGMCNNPAVMWDYDTQGVPRPPSYTQDVEFYYNFSRQEWYTAPQNDVIATTNILKALAL